MVAAVSGVSAGATPQKPSEPALLPVPLHRCSPVKWQPTQHKSTYLTDRVRGVAVPLVSSGSAGAHIGTDARPQTDVYAQLTRLAMVAAGPGSYQALKQRGGPDEVASRPGQNPYRTWHRGADAHVTVLMCALCLCVCVAVCASACAYVCSCRATAHQRNGDTANPIRQVRRLVLCGLPLHRWTSVQRH